MTEIIRVFRVIRIERINAVWYKLNMNIYLLMPSIQKSPLPDYMLDEKGTTPHRLSSHRHIERMIT